MKSKSEKIIVTAALPYANGPIHIGHLLEYIQADIYSRFLKLQGKDCLYICASDMHGTPIEVNAAKEGKKPAEFAQAFRKQHQEDFNSFLIGFDNYYHTDSKENQELVESFFKELKKKKIIYRKKINAIYCTHCQRSLPDRFVKGTCPYCATADQYGDICESCSSTLKGIDLINPKCVICGRAPVQKESEHYFFKLSSFTKKLNSWLQSEKEIQLEVKNWLQEWITKGLEDWCISRDAPYFGFEIPDSKKETGATKYFYVWMDAPIGYISSTKNYADQHKQDWKHFWQQGQVHHFIGKDISYFHFLFWPALLMAMDIPLPKLTVHGFVTVNGEKMSKSRGTFFTAKDFLKLYPAESLRFYYATHLDRKVADVDLNFEDFKEVNNNVLLGNLGNFCYRVLTFAEKNYSAVTEIADDKEMIKEVNDLIGLVEKSYLQQEFKLAVKYILQIADLGNAYFQQAEVWKDNQNKENKKVVGLCVNMVRNIAIMVQPILPEFAHKIRKSLGEKELAWKNINFQWKGKIKTIEKVVQPIETVPALAKFPLQLVVGKIIEIKDHGNADSLYVFKVDLGPEIGKKQVVAGLKKYFSKEELMNRKAVFCANMKPAKLRGEMSEAMILAADDGENVAILEAEKSKIGEEVRFVGMENSNQEITFEEFKRLVMSVQKGKVIFEGKKLSSPVEDIVVHGVKDGSRVR